MNISSTNLKYQIKMACDELITEGKAAYLRSIGQKLTPRQVYIAAEAIEEFIIENKTQNPVSFILNCLEYLTSYCK